MKMMKIILMGVAMSVALGMGVTLCSCGSGYREGLLQQQIDLDNERNTLRYEREVLEKAKEEAAQQRLATALEAEQLEERRAELRVKAQQGVGYDSEVRREEWLKRTKEAERRRLEIVKERAERDVSAQKIAGKKTTGQKEVDKEVAKILGGKHGAMPQAQRLSAVIGNTTEITVKNGTGSVLTVMYSGATTKKVVCADGASETVTLRSGSYKVAARVSRPGVVPFAGTQGYKGGRYSSSFFIRTTKF